MTTAPTTIALPESGVAPIARRSVVAALRETSKPRITRLVTMTSMVGFVLAACARSWTLGELLLAGVATAVGTACSAAGSNALNQWMERERDARMSRTKSRPLPAGELPGWSVVLFGTAMCAAGLAVLGIGAGLAPMVLSAACIVSYLAMYTPLKPVTPLATFVGAIPGALPPMIGAAAASSVPGWHAALEPAGLAVFALMMVWQIPHFLAIAWLYRDDYANGGYAVLPVMDPRGTVTAWTVALWTLALIPATLLPATMLPELLGAPYAGVALLGGVVFAVLAARLVLQRTRRRARELFIASVIHLPILLLAMVVEAAARTLA